MHTYIVYGVYYKILTCTFQYLNSHLSIKARHMAEMEMKCQCSLSFLKRISVSIMKRRRPYQTSEASIVTCIMIPSKMTAYSHRLNSQFTKYERLGNTVSSNWCKSTDRRKPWHRVEALQMENKEQNTQFHTGLTKPIHLFMFLLSFVKPSRSLTFSFRNNYIKLELDKMSH